MIGRSAIRGGAGRGRVRAALGVTVAATVVALASTALLTLSGEPGIPVEARGQILRVGGKAFFPIGLYYAPPRKFEAARDLGFNVVDTWAVANGSTRAVLDRANALGLKVIVVLQGAYRGGVLNEALMRTFVTSLRDHEALLAWYLYDEPQETSSHLRTLQTAYALVKGLDPEHPILTVYDKLGALRMLSHLSDVVGVDPYPVPNVPLSLVSHQVEQARLAVGGRKPVWAIMQAFEKEVPRASSRYPTPEELHNMVYQGLVAGATGIYYFSYEWQGYLEERDPMLWSYLGQINREVAVLAPALLEGTNAGPGLRIRGSPWLKTRAVTFSGRAYVIAVNVRDEPAGIELRGACGGPLGAEVLFESRRLQSRAGATLDGIPPYGVRAYAC